MKKKRVLTTVLAGIMALSAVGCGEKKSDDNVADSEASSEKKVEKQLSFKEIANKSKEQAENVKKALKGELDFAYDAGVTVTLGKSVTGDTEIKPIGFNVSTKQKGKTSGADFGITYDGKSVATIKSVLDREGKNVYLQIPELSESYAFVNTDDASKTLESTLKQNSSYNSFAKIFENAEKDGIDFNIDFKGYGEVFKDNIPEVKDADPLKGEVDGVKYELSTKTVDISAEDATKAVRAVLDKAKTDESIKTIYDKYAKEILKASIAQTSTTNAEDSLDLAKSSKTPSEVKSKTSKTVKSTEKTEEDKVVSYEEFIEQMKKNVDFTKSEDADQKITLDLYYNDKDFAGFNARPADESNKEYVKMVSVINDDTAVTDYDMNMDGQIMTYKGAMQNKDNTITGSYKMSMTENDKETMNATYTIDNVKVDGDNVSGSIKADITADSQKMGLVMNLDCKKDDSKMTYDFSKDGESVCKIDYTLKTTEASDVAIPKENVCNILNSDEMQKFQASLDTSKFMENLKSALGDDLCNQLFAGASAVQSGVANGETDL